MWNEIVTEEDISKFLCLYGNFHDSCIKEIRYVSGAFVNHDFAMSPFNVQRTVDIVFQRQHRSPSVIMLRFIGLNVLRLAPHNVNYTCEIHDAKLFRQDGLYYWADSCDIGNEIEAYEGTWVCSDKIEWLMIDECIGNNEIFTTKLEGC